MYQKEIIYMSLFEHDMKKECIGYLKLEKKQDDFQLELQVKNLPDVIMGSFPIRLQGGDVWREEDTMAIKGGNGTWRGHTREEVLRAEIILPGSYKIRGQSKKAPTVTDNKTRLMEDAPEEKEKTAAQKPRTDLPKQNMEDILSERASEKSSENALPEQSQRQSVGNPSPQIPPEQGKEEILLEDIRSQGEDSAYEGVAQASKSALPVRAVSMAQTGRSIPVRHMPLYESKWEQILATYEKTRPYGDDRIYVKLEPKDFIVLRSDYQHLVNNSFLLHGFYNYRHVILGKEKDYYLGVPGVFYEREKMVALMFGFEAFECEGGSAEEGKFGYYLRKVEI
ncbi:MAG: DUF6128 domain-containing protein [Blautia sp.]|nr:DUF6128 domain-containing protein [Lachnoclostridium sp.]MCM1209983.1 DUF6128 domain-containing protein [Blautia sp.]